MSKHIEMIIDYTQDGNDFMFFDNHGVLVHCGECDYWNPLKNRCILHDCFMTELNYCGDGTREGKDDE